MPRRLSPPARTGVGNAVRRRMLLVVNPHATAVDPASRRTVLATLARGYDVDAVDTEAPGHAGVLAREAAEAGEHDVLVCLGGDGTVNEVVNGLAGSTLPIASLPGGSASVFAKMLGLPGDLPRAAERLVELADAFAPRIVDLASVNGRFFVFSSGVGLDATVVRRVDANPRWKHRFGPWYFAWAGVSEFVKHYVRDPPRLDVHVDGQVLHGVTALVQNGDPYTYFRGLPLHVAEGVALDDGTLAGVVLRSSSPTVMPTVMFRILSARARMADHRQVDGFGGVTEVVVRSADGRPLPVQVDGDFLGLLHEARYGISPSALAVLA